jgi:Zn ribbon nucleic-acid-binding protein
MSTLSRRWALPATLVATLSSSLALAQQPDAPPAAEEAAAPPTKPSVAVTSDTGTGKVDPKTGTVAKGPSPRKQPCGCAQPRLMRRGRSMPLGEGQVVTAWVNVSADKAARVHPFAADFFDRRASAPQDAEIPVMTTLFSDVVDATPSTHVLERVHLAGAYPEGFFLGMLRANDVVPKDVVRVEVAGAPGAPEPVAPRAEQLWLDLVESVERPACGPAFTTTRVAWQEAEGSGPVVGFVAEWVGEDGGRASAVVDARHARTFGLGRVEACDHGLPIPEGQAGTVRLSPVSSSFGRGPAWEFAVAKDGGVPGVVRRPDGVPPALDNPFTTGDFGDRPGIDDTSDKTALGVMLGVVGLAATLGGLLWPALRRRRKLATIVCPACKAEHELDLLDPATDGMFCPSCGKSSIYVALEADGEPRASVFVLGEQKAAAADDKAEPPASA